jgi:hypothetical protein
MNGGRDMNVKKPYQEQNYEARSASFDRVTNSVSSWIKETRLRVDLGVEGNLAQIMKNIAVGHLF